MKKFGYIVSILVFVIVSCLILFGYGQDVLYTSHLRTPFLLSEEFREELFKEPLGCLLYIGCWFTQLGYSPVLASVVLIILWLSAYVLSIQAFRLSERWSSLMIFPLCCLLLSIVDLGYWIYSLHQIGYWFAHSIAYLLMFCLLWCLSRFGDRFSIVGLICCFILFPVLGWYTLLMAVCLVPINWQRSGWFAMVPLLSFVAPWFWQSVLYYDIANQQALCGGFSLFENGDHFCLRPSCPFVLLAILTIIIAGLSRWTYLQKEGDRYPFVQSVGIAVICGLFAYGIVWLMMFRDDNYQLEMRMTRSAMAEDWNQVVSEARKSQKPTQTMVMLKNIALLNTGKLGERSYALGNDGIDICNPDSLTLNPMYIASPIIYYQHGKMNYSIRWCTEMAVDFGYSPFVLVNLVQSSLANGEEKVAQKYLKLLRSRMFYNDWTPKPLSDNVKLLSREFGNVLDTDNSNCDRYLMTVFRKSYHSSIPLVQELSLHYAMLYGEPKNFWQAFVAYVSSHLQQPLPRHIQEAYCIYMDEVPVQVPMSIEINSQIQIDYQTFCQQYVKLNNSGYNADEIRAALHPKWGKTYWWYKCFE